MQGTRLAEVFRRRSHAHFRDRKSGRNPMRQILVLSIRPASDGAMFFYRARSSTFQGEGEVTLMAETHSEAVSDRLSFYRWRRRCGGETAISSFFVSLP